MIRHCPELFPAHNCHESVDSDRDVAESSSLDSNVAPCEAVHEPTSTVTPLNKKQQYLQYIIDTVAEHFPDLGFVLGFDGRDRNNPFLNHFPKESL